MFQSYQRYRRILVTGPMRSGTTICAAMIARDAGKRVVREESLFSVWPYDQDVVIQAPVLMPEGRRLANEGWFVVVMNRNVDDVIASQQKYMPTMNKNFIKSMAMKQVAAAIDLGLWLEEQSSGQKIIYEDLCSHPMWVQERSSFGPRDISTSIPGGNLRNPGEAHVYT